MYVPSLPITIYMYTEDGKLIMLCGIDGRIAPRSGLASKHFIDTGAGVIDADYRGEVKVLLFNHSDVDFEVKEGDRVAQLVLERVFLPCSHFLDEWPMVSIS